MVKNTRQKETNTNNSIQQTPGNKPGYHKRNKHTNKETTIQAHRHEADRNGYHAVNKQTNKRINEQPQTMNFNRRKGKQDLLTENKQTNKTKQNQLTRGK